MQKTKRLFNQRNIDKQNIEFLQNKIKRVVVWEIWICKIWVNIGSESSKDNKYMRPVLIIKTYLGWDLVWIIPITTKYKEKYKKYYFKINNYQKFGLKEQSYCLLNQYKPISIKRLIKKINNTTIKWQYKQKITKNILKKTKNLLSEIHFWYIPQNKFGGGLHKLQEEEKQH